MNNEILNIEPLSEEAPYLAVENLREIARNDYFAVPKQGAVCLQLGDSRPPIQLEMICIGGAITEGMIKPLLHHYDDLSKYLLVSEYIAPKIATLLTNNAFQYLDLAGNARFQLGQHTVFITGQKKVKTTKKKTRASKSLFGQKSALKILYILLKDGAYLDRNYRDIAKAANVSLGTVSNVMSELSNAGVLYDAGSQLQFRDYDSTLEKWAMMYPIALKPSLASSEYEYASPTILEDIDLKVFHGTWGGEMGARLITNYLNNIEFTAYIPIEDQNAFKKVARLRSIRQDESAYAKNRSITLIEPFWNQEAVEVQNACPIISYAELMASDDPRNIEVAKRMLHERPFA